MKNNSVLRMMVILGVLISTAAVAFAGQPPVTITVSTSPSPMVSGQDNSINVSITDPGTGAFITQGRVHVKLATYTDPLTQLTTLSPCAGSNGWSPDLNVGNTLNASAPSAVADAPITLGYSAATVGVRVEYEPAGSGYHQTTINCQDFNVNSAPVCRAGLNIYEEAVDGPSVLPSNSFKQTISGSGTWQLLITVENCNPFGVTNVKAQGGTSAWTTPALASGPTLGGFSILKKTSTNKSGGTNYVITWNIPSMDAYQKATVLVNLSGSIQCGQTLPLNGAWSVLSDQTPKSDYTGITTVYANCQ